MINNNMVELGSKRSVIREIFEYSRNRSTQIGAENVFDFSLGNPSVPPPIEVEETVTKLMREKSAIELHGYTSAQGDLSVRNAIAKNINKRFSQNITADGIYMTCGAAASLSICLKAICNAGDEVLVLAPYFTEYNVFINNAGAKLVSVAPMDKTFQVDIEDFENKITKKTKAVIINSPNNPSGVVYNHETLQKMTDVLKKMQQKFGSVIYVIADEPYRELVYNNVKVPYLMDYYDNTMVCYSFSKSLSLPGERIGYIAVCPRANDERKLYFAVCGAGRSLGYVCAPSLFQQVVRDCIDVKVNVDAYQKNRNLLLDGLTKIGYECVRPDGAFYLFVKSPSNDAFEFYERAKKQEVLVVPCDDFGVKGYVRIAYCVPYERIQKALPAFEKIFNEYNK